ncbi:hypothetical protein H2248_004269 [Termitomyces sp. 'cryptogamus']|nr:hypothetical protein H2248_004269 [Termitomyces sp. 'cryptogamus']
MVLLLSSFSLLDSYGRIDGTAVTLTMVFCGAIFISYRDLQQRFKRRRLEISELHRELDEARGEIRTKDELLTVLTREVNERNQRLEEKERSLNEARVNNQALSAQLGRRNQEMQQHKREHALTVELLDARTQELKGAEAFLTKADTLSGAEVIALVNTLNSEIYQTAAMVAEAFNYKARAEGVNSSVEEASGLIEAHGSVTDAVGLKRVDGDENNAEEIGDLTEDYANPTDTVGAERVEGDGINVEGAGGLTEIYASVTDAVGTKMMEMLKSLDHREDPTIVQVAFQTAMAAISNWIVRSWNLEDTETDNGLNKVYKEMRETEEQAISGRWRALTRRYLPNVAEHELSYLFIDAIINILLVANAVQSHDELLKTVETRFAERIAIIVRSAQNLRKAIGEGVTSCDFEVIFIDHDTMFSPAQMDDEYAGDFEQEGPVLCTVQLGLQKIERRSGKEAIWEGTILVRPKIALKSGIMEMVGSTDNSP